MFFFILLDDKSTEDSDSDIGTRAERAKKDHGAMVKRHMKRLSDIVSTVISACIHVYNVKVVQLGNVNDVKEVLLSNHISFLYLIYSMFHISSSS